MIKLSNVCMEYIEGIPVLNNISLDIKSGEIFTILGPNGAGKSTLIKILSTLVPPTKGNIMINGYDILKNSKDIRKDIACVSQSTSIDDFLTVEENMSFQARLYGIAEKDIENRVNHLLKLLDLNNYVDYQISKLSGGVRRRVDIAVNMMSFPKILFLDEPTTGMDISSRNRLWSGIKRMKDELKTTIILTTHYLEEAEKLSDTICIINDGSVVKQGSVENLKKILNRKKIVIKTLGYCEEIINILKKTYNVKYEGRTVEVLTKDPELEILRIAKIFCDRKHQFSSISVVESNLEDIFLFYVEGSDNFGSI